MSEIAVGVLMPRIHDWERFAIRYRGLEEQIECLGMTALFAEGYTTYQADTHGFSDTLTVSRAAGDPSEYKMPVVRDLTMQNTLSNAIYHDAQAPELVNTLALNTYLKDKSNLASDLPDIHPATIVANHQDVEEAVAATPGETVVVKPVTGERSIGVFIGNKQDVPRDLQAGCYLVSEFIDTSGGFESLGISGVHNVRMLSINSQLVGAIGRVQPVPGRQTLEDDEYGRVYLPETLPTELHHIADAVHRALKTKPGNGKNVVAIDTMRGIDASGEQVDRLVEVNRKPLRISAYSLRKTGVCDPTGMAWLADQWDKHEAALLVGEARRLAA